MKKSKIHKLLLIVIPFIFAVAVFAILFQIISINNSNKSVQSVKQGESIRITVECDGLTEKTDTWVTTVQMSDNSNDTTSLTGATLGIRVNNHQNFSIHDWHLRINVNQEFYLNGFWCGTFEIHQFRNGKEIVEVVDSNSYDLRGMQLEHNEYSNTLFIHLQPGDYLIYNPSIEENENVIPEEGTVNIGYIAYFKTAPVLYDCELTYYTDKKYTDGMMFNFIVLLIIILLMTVVMHLVSVLTYKRTKKEIESVTGSVIEALSIEYQTLWLINVPDKTIQLIRNVNDEKVKEAIQVAKDFEDYNYAIKFYIDQCVATEDRDRVWQNVEFDALLEHLKEEAFYTVNYIHSPIPEYREYFQMAFTRAVDSGNDRIVLAYRNVDKIVKEEQEKKKMLQDALNEAEKANRSKTVFLANMSHEIRTPINAILGMNTMILRESSEESIKEYAKDIKTASNTLLTIVNDILDFSKIESGKIELIEANYRLDSVINDLRNMIKPKADEKELEFILKTDSTTPVELFGDEIRVKQIILNLLTNAVKYTARGTVTWEIGYERLDENKCKLLVSVRDTGMGIKKEDMDKLYSPYARLDENINRTIEGTGLGLSITKNLLEMMNSELKLESVYNEGSVFSFELVQTMYGEKELGDNLDKSFVDEEKAEKYHAPKAKVLVVDDVTMNLIVIKNLLKRIKISPDTVLSGKEALQKCIDNRYDIILLDAMMPEMNGEETLHAIKEQSELNKNTPIIVLTANALVGAKEEYLEKGFTDYLSKPVDGILLEDMVAQYINPQLLESPLDSSAETEISEEQEEKSIISILKGAAAINVTEGILAAGDSATYTSICDSFYQTADARIDMIRDALNENNIENYTIQVHALKSSARLVGALELSNLAQELEIAGKENNTDLIRQKSEKLISGYRDVKLILGEAFMSVENSDETQKREISNERLNQKLLELAELVEAFDYESSKELMKNIGEHKLPADFKKVYAKLRVLMAEVARDEIIETVKNYVGDKK